MGRILVTGAGGFIGRALCPALAAAGHQVIAGLRRPMPAPAGAEPRVIGDIVPGRRWGRELDGSDVVIHLAQRAHRRAGEALAGEPQAAAELAAAAALAGTSRFVYLSSIKAMGEETAPGRPFHANDPPHPADRYGIAKLASERALAQFASPLAPSGGLELAIVRPPLVYGPDVAGNFRALLWLAGSSLPLPFAAIDNRRSVIALDNLVDLVARIATHREAVGRVLLASDGPALSTPALIRALAEGQDRRARLFALPSAVLAAARRMPALGPPLSRLTLSLEVDDSPTRAALGWTPPVTPAAALRATAQAFSQSRRRHAISQP